MKSLILILAAMFLVAGCQPKNKENKESSMSAPTGKSDQEYVDTAMGYLKQGDPIQAIQNFDMAIKTNPTNVNNYMVLGEVYLKLKQPVRAIDTFSAASRIAPQNGDVYYLLALSELMDNRVADAEQHTKQSIEIFMAAQDQEKFKRSATLLKAIAEKQNPSVVQ